MSIRILFEILFGDGKNFEIIFPAAMTFVGVAVGGIISGVSAFIAARYQTQNNIKQAEKERRREVAGKISEIMSKLFATAARNLTIPYLYLGDDYDKLFNEMLTPYLKALAVRYEYAYCLPQYVQEDIQEFLDATYKNLKRWQRRVETIEKSGEPLTLEESHGLLPHQDQLEGIAGKAFEKACSSLHTYVEDNNA